MKCPNCGNEINVNAKFCPACGETLRQGNDAWGQTPPDPWAQQASPNQNSYNGGNNGYVPPPPPPPYVNDDSNTYGILALVFCFVFPGIVPMILAIVGRNKAKAAGNTSSQGLCTAALIISIVEMVLTVIGIIVYVVIIVGMMATVDSYMYDMLLPILCCGF